MEQKEITPKEKAQELVERFSNLQFSQNKEYNNGIAKQCALIAVDELIQEHTWASPISWNNKRKAYWQKVKEEIENINNG